MRKALMLTVIASAACAGLAPDPATHGGVLPTAHADLASPELAGSTFDRLAQLEGEWVGTVGDDPTLKVRLTYQVVANGHAIVETQYIPTREGDPVMLSVYYLDNGRLRMDRFCAANNQPRMVLDARSTRGEATFTYVGATGVLGSDNLHVHGGQIRFLSNDRILAVWQNYQGGEHVHDNEFHLTRAGD